MAKASRELQFSTQQLIGVFLGILALGIFVFLLGISIGISTVILISSAINGLNTNIDQFVKSLGTNALIVYRYNFFGRRPTTENVAEIWSCDGR